MMYQNDNLHYFKKVTYINEILVEKFSYVLFLDWTWKMQHFAV